MNENNYSWNYSFQILNIARDIFSQKYQKILSYEKIFLSVLRTPRNIHNQKWKSFPSRSVHNQELGVTLIKIVELFEIG